MKTILSVLAIAALNASAVTITFDDLADGTPLSAGNPYSAAVTLEGHSREFVWYDPAGPPTITEREFTIHGGIAREPVFLTELSPVTYGSYYDGDGELQTYVIEPRYWRTDLTLEFLQPVASLSFSTEAFVTAHFSYTLTDGVNTQEEFFRWGGNHDHEYATYTVEVPAGYLITSARLGNGDENSPRFADFSVDSISFALPAAAVGDDAGPVVAMMAGSLVLTLACARSIRRSLS